jgi:hypothetical protein
MKNALLTVPNLNESSLGDFAGGYLRALDLPESSYVPVLEEVEDPIHLDSMLNPGELEKDLWVEDRTDAQRRDLWREKYAGQKVSWIGLVHSIEDRSDPALWRKVELSAYVTSLRLGDMDLSGLSVFASAPRSRLEEFAKFSKGSPVIISGTLAPEWRGIAGGHNIHMLDACIAPISNAAEASAERHETKRGSTGLSVLLLVSCVISLLSGFSTGSVLLEALAFFCWVAAGILPWIDTSRIWPRKGEAMLEEAQPPVCGA